MVRSKDDLAPCKPPVHGFQLLSLYRAWANMVCFITLTTTGFLNLQPQLNEWLTLASKCLWMWQKLRCTPLSHLGEGLENCLDSGSKASSMKTTGSVFGIALSQTSYKYGPESFLGSVPNSIPWAETVHPRDPFPNFTCFERDQVSTIR